MDQHSNGKPRFNVNTILAVVQILVVLIGGVIAFQELKSDIRIIARDLAGLERTVEKVTDYLGIWTGRKPPAEQE